MKDQGIADIEAKSHRTNYDYRYGDSMFGRAQRSLFSG
jgi:hypothetical protein